MSLADPQSVGEWLMAKRREKPGISICDLADFIPWDDMPTPFDAARAEETAAEYRREMEALAAAGNKHAEAMLRKLNGEEIGEDPSG